MLREVSGTLNTERIGDVVFVHGLDGNAITTWQKDDASFWPHWLGEDLPEIAVWSLDYEAASIAWKGSAMPLSDRATNVLALMEANSFGERPLVFVAHSLGGLVVKQILRNAIDYAQPHWKAIADQTRGIIFIATPHSGSDLASWLQYASLLIRTNATIKDLQANDAGLRNLNFWFRSQYKKLGIKCQVYAEKQKVRNLLVVDETSADPGIEGVIPIPVDANHIDICKVKSRQDLVYTGTKAFVKECFDLGDGPWLLSVRVRRAGNDKSPGIDGADVVLSLSSPQSAITENGGHSSFWIDKRDLGTFCEIKVHCPGFKVPTPRKVHLTRDVLRQPFDFRTNKSEILVELESEASDVLSPPVVTQPHWIGSTIHMNARAKHDGTEYHVPAHPLGEEGFHLVFGISNQNQLDMAIESFQLELIEFIEMVSPELSMFVGAAMPTRKFLCDMGVEPRVYPCKTLSGDFDYIRLSQNEMERFDIEVRASAEGIYRIRPMVRYSVSNATDELALDNRVQTVGFFDSQKHEPKR